MRKLWLTLAQRWRQFWWRRSRTRMRLGFLILAVAVLVAAYSFVPADVMITVNAALGGAFAYLASLRGVQALALGWAALFALLGITFIFLPTYRHFPMLTTESRGIAPVSVYLDAENQLLNEDAIRGFLSQFYKAFSRGRVDMLYFMDPAEEPPSNPKRGQRRTSYRQLYLAGFRPVDVPRNPTNANKPPKERVDHEIALYALERALLGPAHQSIILVTGDGDYLPLIFRLVALGHDVQIWAGEGLSTKYESLALLDGFAVIHLKEATSAGNAPPVADDAPDLALGAPATASQPKRGATTKRKKKTRAPTSFPKIRWHPAPVSVPVGDLTLPGEIKLYQAIMVTLQAHAEAHARGGSGKAQFDRLGTFLLRQPEMWLTNIGYGVGSKTLQYWIAHLMALGIFEKRADTDAFPLRGAGDPLAAVRSLHAMAREAALAACAASASAPDEFINMTDIVTMLASLPADQRDPQATPLRELVDARNQTCATHMRYFVHCARALELVDFTDDRRNVDKIRGARPGEGLERIAMPQDAATSTPKEEGI